MRQRRPGFLEGTLLEKLFYELKPFLCLGGGCYLLKGHDLLLLGRLGATLLLLSGLFILFERARYRGYLK
jgi:hypothetical protein